VLLSDGDLTKELANGRLVLEPWDAAMLQPSSIDVRLDRYFRVFQNSRYTHIDPREQQDELTTPVEPDGDDPFVLHPGEFVLGSTFEAISLPDDLAGRLEGKSSLGRLGLLTHSTAGFIDPGFSGHITLELSNVANLPITLWPGMKIGQLCLFRLSSPSERPYGSEGVGSRTRASGARHPRAPTSTSTRSTPAAGSLPRRWNRAPNPRRGSRSPARRRPPHRARPSPGSGSPERAAVPRAWPSGRRRCCCGRSRGGR
jgi:dCTP deaminase